MHVVESVEVWVRLAQVLQSTGQPFPPLCHVFAPRRMNAFVIVHADNYNRDIESLSHDCLCERRLEGTQVEDENALRAETTKRANVRPVLGNHIDEFRGNHLAPSNLMATDS